MRIGIFSDTYPPYINGVATSIIMLKQALEKKGHEVFIVTVNSEGMSYKYENSNKIIRIPGIPIGIYDYRLTGIYPLKALEKIKKWNLDVIHSHTEFGVGTFARIVSKQLDIPLVHTYHTLYEDYTHYITKGYFNGASRKIVEYLTKFYCDKMATELIVPTKKIYDLFKEKYRVDRSVHIIPTGIEIEKFYREKYEKEEINEIRNKLGFKEDDFIILFVGRLAKEKNVELLIDSQQYLAKKYPNCKLLIIGDGPDMKVYKKRIEKCNLTDNIIFTGKIPWEIVPKYYQLASIFATASHTETQGLTVIEALGASVPVVALEDESFTPIIVNEYNGLLFRTRRQYKKCVEKLINDKELINQMSMQARNSAEPYSSKYFADKVLYVYRLAIGDNSKGRNKKFLSRLKDVVKKGFNGK